MATTVGTIFAQRNEEEGWWNLSYVAERSEENKKIIIYHIYADYRCYAYSRALAPTLYFNEESTGHSPGSIMMHTDREEHYGLFVGDVEVELTGDTASVEWHADNRSGNATFIIPPGGAPSVSVFDGSAWKDADEVTEYDSGWKTADAVSAYDGGWKES